MSKNKNILDEYGEKIIKIYDDVLNISEYSVDEIKKTKRFENLFSNLNEKSKQELILYSEELINGAIFDFLKIFEENPQFKIIHEDENGNQTDLNKISEMLKAEPIIEGGWIERFSKYSEDFKKRKEEENKQFED